ncbi:MAG: hypothetical protein M1495_02085 [Bacteroidetes bacterium]|nr:hypothetical protein [Bacteroidota bacterium]
MSNQMNKITNDVIAALKKFPAPGKKSGSFWDFMKSQLADDSTWDQSHLKVIEKEIDTHLSKLDKKSITELWKNTDVGGGKYESEKKVETKEMKTDLTDELMGMVMDRMDDNYSSRDSYHAETSYFEPAAKSENGEEDFDEDKEPEVVDEDLNLDDDELFDDEDLDDDEDSRL